MNRKVYVPDGSRAAIAVAFQCACRSRVADRYSLQTVTEVAVSSSQYDVVPQMIIRSPKLRPGELAIGDAKRL
jgi:2-polyprenyl-3-methyl-5-hydroxy-6-metoxy-1,4-benzoquinol methylase